MGCIMLEGRTRTQNISSADAIARHLASEYKHDRNRPIDGNCRNHLPGSFGATAEEDKQIHSRTCLMPTRLKTLTCDGGDSRPARLSRALERHTTFMMSNPVVPQVSNPLA